VLLEQLGELLGGGRRRALIDDQHAHWPALRITHGKPKRTVHGAGPDRVEAHLPQRRS
jgi:hypothetical protein